jgi:hypothetical protein
VIVKARPETGANKTTPSKRMRRADEAWGRKAANTPACEARPKATPSETAMAETCAAKAAMTSDAASER